MSYSCGKDSTLALHKMLAAGHEPAALVVMFNESAGRSYFHGADRPMLEAYGRALGLPVRPVPTAGETYHLAMETALVRITRETGAEAVCFGNIDIQANRDWCEARARAAGLKPFFPLWQRDRRENVREVMDLGYRCIIKSIHNTLLPPLPPGPGAGRGRGGGDGPPWHRHLRGKRRISHPGGGWPHLSAAPPLCPGKGAGFRRIFRHRGGCPLIIPEQGSKMKKQTGSVLPVCFGFGEDL